VSDRLTDLKLADFLDRLASDSPTPGGGSASALAGALACALVEMVARLTLGRERYAAAETQMTETLSRAGAVRRELADLIDQDARAFEAVMAAYRLPRGTEDEKNSRRAAIEEATKQAAQVPLRVTELACEVLSLARTAAEHGNPNAVTDAGVAGHLALTAAEGAALNVRINLAGLKDDSYRAETERRVEEHLRRARDAARDIAAAVRQRMG